MILNFLDPALERIWRARTYPYLPGNPDTPLIRHKLAELYEILDGLHAAGLKGMKGREVEKTGPVYHVAIDCGFVCFRLAGRNVADVGFESAARGGCRPAGAGPQPSARLRRAST